MPDFIDYVYSFYGCPVDNLYPMIKDGLLLTKEDIIKAVKVYQDRLLLASIVKSSHYTWGDGDSLDRERVRDILINDFAYTWGA